jgi:predicted polyphosphate/ATP-dependent NAD kinase
VRPSHDPGSEPVTHADVPTVGVIINPHAGKDIRRLVSAAGQTSDAVKIGIVRRVVVGALEQGAKRILLSSDTHQLAERAVAGIDGPIEFVESPLTGSHLDSVAAARSMWKEQAGAIVALGGDGTCRDVATGWPDAPLIALSTGTNNVFPSTLDGTTAGVAAGLVATGAVDLTATSHQAKRVALRIDDPRRDTVRHEVALVEAALIDTAFVGARAVNDPATIRWVVAAIAEPASTGVASIAGRVHPVDRREPGGVLIRLGAGDRQVRVPLAPGSFATVDVESVEPLTLGEPVDMPGGGVLAFDGERTTPVSADSTITVAIEASGPRVIDVEAALVNAARNHCFDAPRDLPLRRKDPHGD